MDKKNIRELLVRLAAGAATVDEVMEELREEPFRDLGFAKIDSHRSLRQGIAEVIYGAGKRPGRTKNRAHHAHGRGGGACRRALRPARLP